MINRKTDTHITTQIAISVSALIVGGFVIFIMSSYFPLPGVKYLFMSPYLSLIIALVMRVIKTRALIIKVNTVFALIMVLINIYMGLAIFLTGIFTQLLALLVPKNFRYYVQTCAASYSGFTVGTALIVSKQFIGGPAFENISNSWIIMAIMIAIVLGFFGSIPGYHIGDRIRKATAIGDGSF